MSGTRQRNLAALGVASFLSGLVAIDILVPVYIRSLGGTLLFLGTFYSSMGLVSLLLKLPSGYYSDKVGRRPVLLLGSLFKALGSVILSLSTGLLEALPALLLRRVGIAVENPVSLAVISDSTVRRRAGLIFGVVLSVIGLAGAVGPVLTGSVVDIYGLRSAFDLNAVLAVLSLLVLVVAVKETSASGRVGQRFRGLSIFKALKGNRNLLILFASYFFYSGALSCRLPFFTIYVNEELGLTYLELGVIVGAGSFVALLTRISSGFLADKLGGKNVLIAAGIVRTTSFLLIPFTRDPLHLVIVYSAFSFFMCGPPRNALITEITPSSIRGEIFGGISAVGDLATTLIPLLAGLVAQSLSLNVVFGAMAVLNILNIAAILMIKEPKS